MDYTIKECSKDMVYLLYVFNLDDDTECYYHCFTLEYAISKAEALNSEGNYLFAYYHVPNGGHQIIFDTVL